MDDIFGNQKIKPSPTRRLISNAYLQLLRQKPDEQITVSEICTAAQVARKSFYNNFRSKTDIIAVEMSYFLDNWDALNRFNLPDITAVYRAAFEFVLSLRELMLLLKERNLFAPAEDALTEYCMQRWPNDKARLPVDKKLSNYYIRATISLFVSLIKTWTENNFQESVDELVMLADSLILAAPNAVEAFTPRKR